MCVSRNKGNTGWIPEDDMTTTIAVITHTIQGRVVAPQPSMGLSPNIELLFKQAFPLLLLLRAPKYEQPHTDVVRKPYHRDILQ